MAICGEKQKEKKEVLWLCTSSVPGISLYATVFWRVMASRVGQREGV
jgi:hypothetical protein